MFIIGILAELGCEVFPSGDNFFGVVFWLSYMVISKLWFWVIIGLLTRCCGGWLGMVGRGCIAPAVG